MRVLGLDLSLTGTGMLYVPTRWGLDWSKIIVEQCGYELHNDASQNLRADRVIAITETVVSFAKRHHITDAVVEQYALRSGGRGGGDQAHALGELGGHCKGELRKMGIDLHAVPPASSRQLLGKPPRAGAKAWAALRVFGAGAPKSWTLDQADAFVAVNHHLSQHGGDALILEEAA